MSLLVTLRINGDRPHAGLLIRRLSGDGEADSVNTYDYSVFEGEARVAHGEVAHRYGDGSLALLAAVCRAAGLDPINTRRT